MSRVVLASLLLVVASSASGQVIYQPVQYQYSSGGRAYYYGGADPAVHRRAQALSQEPGFGRANGYAFVAGDVDRHREVVTEPTRAFSDSIPYWNARVFGYTPDDARNAAYGNASTYFRKADVAALSIRQTDGTWVVPSQPTPAQGAIEIRPYVKPVTRPAAEPKPILIIPKRMLDQRLMDGVPVASAR